MPSPPSSAAGSAVVALAQIPRLAAVLRGARARSPASDAAEGSQGKAAKFACADRVGLLQADITTLRVDAIVNAANRSLLGGGGVDGAIHRAAGKELLEACRELDGCDTGDAKTTGAFKLPSKHIVHTVGPVYSKTKPEQSEAQLRSAYRRSLEEAAAVGARSVAFPSISTGVYGYPIEDATRVALRVVGEWLTASEGAETELVVFCTFSKKDRDVYERLAPEYFEAGEEAEEQADGAAPAEQEAEAGATAAPTEQETEADDAAASKAQEASAPPEKVELDEGVTTRAQAKTVAERRSASPQQERAATRD